MDPYKILGISSDASDDEVKKAYRKLAKQYHPDVNKEAGAADKFKEVQNAYDTIMDMRKNPHKYRGGYSSNQGYSSSHGYSDFGGFGGFGNFGGFNQGFSQEQQFDSIYANVVNLINQGNYQGAYYALNQMSNRDAQWYYLYCIVNLRLDNRLQALEAIEKACQLDPTNTSYRQLYTLLNQSRSTYHQSRTFYGSSMASQCCQCLMIYWCCCSGCRCC